MLEQRGVSLPKIAAYRTVAGLTMAHQKDGKLRWEHILAPAIKLAADGFAVDAALARCLKSAIRESTANAELRRVYGKEGGKDQWKEGDTLRLPDLAWTLRQIAEQGPYAFYKGAVAEKFIAEMQLGGGLIIKQDLEKYQAELRKPVHGNYRGYDVYAPGPPSSGGICLVEMLNTEIRSPKHDRFSPGNVASHDRGVRALL